jgi:NAD(P)-dependent dehydrogenase (short-subunit alcohol dehydrogenase family)
MLNLLSLLSRDLDGFADEITFSTVAPLRVSRAFLPLIKKSELKRIIFISSVLASSHITFLMAGQFNAYSVAKAALNMLASVRGKVEEPALQSPDHSCLA